MQDLTTGSVSRHLLKTTGFMLVMMIFSTLYFIVDLYWVGRLGTAAVAGVGIAGNVTFITMAVMQMLAVGTTTIVSHATGRKNREEAQHFFNQAFALSLGVGVLFLVLGLAVRPWYTRTVAADAATAKLAGDYLLWFIPAMAVQLALGSSGAALRAIGNFKAPMVVSTASVLLNMLLAPFLIFGWGTGRAFGVAGAAMSSLVSIVIAVGWIATYFRGQDAYLHFSASHWRPQWPIWRRIMGIGLPAGFEFGMMAVYQLIILSISRPFGAAAQAGFAIGMRVIQAGFMPVVALGMAVAPVAGQNFGARLADRVRAAYRDAALMGAGAMVLLSILVQVAPGSLIHFFAKDPAVIAMGTEYLRIISWNFVPSGVVFVTASMFQAMGNTIPSLFGSTVRIVVVMIPAVLLSRVAGFQLRWVWWLSVAAVWSQLLVNWLLLRREFRKRLDFGVSAPEGALPSAPAPALEIS